MFGQWMIFLPVTYSLGHACCQYFCRFDFPFFAVLVAATTVIGFFALFLSVW